MDLAPELSSLAFLVGTWSGFGHGSYPTVDDFTYAEESTFAAPAGKPFLHYTQRTRRSGSHPEAGTALHTETGYLRPVGTSGVELVLVQPTGIVEIHEGSVEGTKLALAMTRVATTSSAKEVSSVERRFELVGDELRYELWMGAVGQPHQFHLAATLRR